MEHVNMYDYLRKLDCRLQTLYGLILFEYILFECLFECALMYLENRPSVFFILCVCKLSVLHYREAQKRWWRLPAMSSF